MAKAKITLRKGAYVQTEKGRTEQDAGPGINELVRRFMHSGQPIPQAPWQTGEQPTADTIAHARDTWAAAQTHFEELPSHLRDHFDHDPEEYFAYIEDKASEIDENGLEAVLKGVIAPTPENGSQEPSEAQNAPLGATESDAGTEQTS